MTQARPAGATETAAPAVSVVIPTYRRVQLLQRCLCALLDQTLPAHRYEVLVVDDGRDAQTRRAVEALAAHASVRLVYIPARQGARGPAAARNVGWRAARAATVAFTDDDTVPRTNWLAEGLAAFADTDVALSGQVRVPIEGDPSDYARNVQHLEHAEFVTANCFVRRDALAAVDGFDERFTRAWREDSDLHFKLLEHFGKVGRAPRAEVLHPVRSAPWGISLREQRNMFFDALLFRKHPLLYRRRIRARPPLRYYTIVAALATAGVAIALSARPVAIAASAVWAALTLALCLRRLRGTRRSLSHVAEMAVTSAVIPLAAVYWRLAGAWHFRTPFL